MEEKPRVEYEKTCRNPDCKKVFKSFSRNTRYCSPECLETMTQKNRALGKRRRNYQKNSVMLRAQSMSRKQARMYAFNELVPCECQICHKTFYLKDIEVAHKDQNPFNNDKENFGLFCVPCHREFDANWKKEHPAEKTESEAIEEGSGAPAESVPTQDTVNSGKEDDQTFD